MAQCPGSTADGCRCTEHHPGLSEYTRDPQAYLAALERLVPVELHAVAPLMANSDGCKGGMLCDCHDCTKERTAATRRQRAASARQPWEPRPSRHLRAA